MFEWDRHKAVANLRKHGVRLVDAQDIFEDERALLLADDHPNEERWIAIGSDLFGRILVVVFTYRGSTIRLISARKATARERRQYEATD